MFKTLLSILFSLFFCSLSNANIVGADTQNFNPVYGHDDFVTVRSSAPLELGELNISFFSDYSQETLPVYPNIVNQNIGDTAGYSHLGLGIGVLDWLDLGASFALIFSQEVDNAQLRGQFAEEGLVEIMFGGKAQLLRFEGGGGVALAASIGLNRINNNPFLGADPGPTLNIEAIADRHFGPLKVAGNIGYRLREPGPSNTSISGFGDIEPLGDAFILSGALSYDFTEKWTVLGELYTAFPDGDFGGVDIDRDPESFEFLVGAKYKFSEKLNVHGGFTREINHGLSTPAFRLYGGVNWIMGPLWGNGPKKPRKIKKAKKLDARGSFYDQGFRKGYLSGFGIGPYAGKGPNHGEVLNKGREFPEGFYDGYNAADVAFPEDVVAKTPYAKCYRMGFRGKLDDGPAAGQGLGYGELLGLGVYCEKGFNQGWKDAPEPEKAKESFYNIGYREGYKAGYGIGPYAGLGPENGETLNGGYEFPEGYFDGYSDAIGPFPGKPTTRTYGKGYRLGFQGKLGQGPGKGTGPDYGPSINPDEPFPRGFEHGWIDAPDTAEETPLPDPIEVDAYDLNAFDKYEARKEEVFRLSSIVFSTDSYKFKKSQLKILDSLAGHLNKGTGFRKLIIEGHTDSDGEAMYNERLSLQRAKMVEKYLVEVHKFESDKIDADGWGERKPISPNDTKANKQRNRRVEFKIYRD